MVVVLRAPAVLSEGKHMKRVVELHNPAGTLVHVADVKIWGKPNGDTTRRHCCL